MIFRILIRRNENKWKPEVDFRMHLAYHLLLSMIELSMSVNYAICIGSYLLLGHGPPQRIPKVVGSRLVASLQV